MNHQLSNIELLVQQSSLTEEEKQKLLKEILSADKQWNILEFKLDRTEKVKKTTAVLLEETIEELEKKRKDVEAQNHELEIEGSLERVRAVAMGMAKPGDLLTICETMFHELQKLGFSELRNTLINIHNDDKGSFLNHDYSDELGKSITTVSYSAHAFIKRQLKQVRSANDAFSEIILTGNELNEWIEVRRKNGENEDPRLENARSLYYYFYSIGVGAIGISTLSPIGEKKLDLLKRFRNVFNLSYQRYMDITQAEAQAKESQIQLALERVRARTMAMQKSDELSEAVYVLFQQFKELGEKPDQATIGIINEDEKVIEYWVTMYGNQINKVFKFSIDEPNVTRKIYKSWKEKKRSLVIDLSGKALSEFIAYRAAQGGAIANPNEKRRIINVAFFSKGLLNVQSDEERSGESIKLLERFAAVFEQTYTRFLDLQKAEVQAREAQIEAALEKVRSRSLGMQKSEELREVIQVIYEQLKQLNFEISNAGFLMDYQESEDGNIWMTDATTEFPTQQYIPSFDHPFNDDYREQRDKGLQLFTKVYPFEEKNRWWEVVFKYLPAVSKETRKAILGSPALALSRVLMQHIGLYLLNYAGTPYSKAENAILIRFGKVFEQAFTRFNDLKQAEAQAREAQIQLALERVRAKTMAMHKSEGLIEIMAVMFEQLAQLQFRTDAITLSLEYKTNILNLWMAVPGQAYPAELKIPYANISLITRVMEAVKSGNDFYSTTCDFEEKNQWIDHLLKYTVVKDSPDDRKQFLLQAPGIALSIAMGKNIALLVANYEIIPFSDEENGIIKRFANVFEQSYIRFLDLQKAEAQAREAQIQLALERVRARTMAMQHSDELAEAATVLFEQFNALGSEPERIVIVTVNEKENVFESWPTQHGGSKIDKLYKLPLDESPVIQKTYAAWKAQTKSIIIDLQGNELEEYFQFLKNAGVPVQRGIFGNRRIQHVATFSKGVLNLITSEPRPRETIEILERFASVFDLTYTRFLDLQRAEAQAREAHIEAALERVRSRSLAMHKSDELREVVAVVFEKLDELITIAFDGVSILIPEKGSQDLIEWVANPGKSYPEYFKTPYIDNPMISELLKARESGVDFFSRVFNYDEKNALWKYAFENSGYKNLPDEMKKRILESDSYAYSVAFQKNSSIVVASISGQVLPENEVEILKRFGRAFEQSYIRFLDLQKAEAQAREAQIETSLERVRSKTMAMHNSNDVGETVAAMFAEFVHLGIITNRCGILIFNDEHSAEVWTARSTPEGKAKLIIGKLDLHMHEMLASVGRKWKAKEAFYQYELTGEDLIQYYTAINNAKFYPTQFDLNALRSKEFHSDFFFADGAVFCFTNEPVAEEHAKIIKRFAGVFGQTYRRYLDLLKAEVQAREAQIEAALERVRSRSLAMHKSDELKEAGELLWNELGKLGIESLSSGYVLMDKEEKIGWIYAPNPATGKIAEPLGCLHTETKEMRAVLSSWEKQEQLSVIEMDEQETIAHQTFIAERALNLDGTICRWITAEQLIALSPKRLFLHNFNFKQGYLMIVGGSRLTDKQIELMLRFTKVFQQTYTRFLDLHKAESQARESQIQLALERARAQSMMMQHSTELDDTLRVFHEQVLQLNIPSAFSFLWLPDEEKDRHIFWAAWAENNSTVFKSKALNYPLDRNESATAQCLVDWKSNEPVVSYHVPPDGVANYFAAWSELIAGVEQLNPEYFSDGLYYVEAFMKYGCFGVMVKHPLNEHEKKILERFTVEFERAYTRFLDLQKAEAQAKEAEIEAALEKVRSRSLAMRTSDELGEVVAVVIEKLSELDLKMDGVIIAIYTEGSKDQLHWTIAPDLGIPAMHLKLPYFDNILITDYFSAKEKGLDFFQKQYSFEEKNSFFDYIYANTDYKQTPDNVKEFCLKSESYAYSIAFAKNSGTMLLSFSGHLLSENEAEILKRFSRVFEQTYTRFLDLQKAEAQAREAQIEAALERVRSRSLAMHKSDELQEVVHTILERLKELKVDFYTAIIVLFTEGSKDIIWWLENTENQHYPKILIPYSADIMYLKDLFEAKENGKGFFSKCYLFEEKNKMFRYLFDYTDLEYVPENRKKFLFETKFSTISVALANNTGIHLTSYSNESFSESDKEILKRFAKVFGQVYTRFLDLQKAEAQALESIKRASVDRVRAEIASMRTTNDLERITPIIWNELTTLGVPFIRCGVFIMDEEQQQIETHLSTPDGESIAAFKLPYSAPGETVQILAHWHKKELYKQHWNEAQFVEFTQNLMHQGAIKSGEKYLKEHHPIDLYLHFLPFLQGMLYAGNTAPLSDDALQLMQNLADAFSTAYARYEDFNKLEAAKKQVDIALNKVQATQKQLIQSEKMASLGELTAGIAHEIQNPLNFVNNFSEVNNELIEELKSEKSKVRSERDEDLENEILNDIYQNNEKINLHGKRADAIVKGMLQHSRTSTGQKEPTDINALCDEYLRLSYHGLRAKDKSFNADIKTDFDQNIGKISVVPQDIGRVLLNLFNNAFYTVNEKKKDYQLSAMSLPTTEADYEPLVSVQTKKLSNRVEIVVEDNGNGIPESIKEKIFQPFFTTKPTGKGTGLGLSLSYDIIKAHGGEIKVQTREGEGSEFVIQLPV
jgi:signal transduction histidine kinase